jgi:hypothetical protein
MRLIYLTACSSSAVQSFRVWYASPLELLIEVSSVWESFDLSWVIILFAKSVGNKMLAIQNGYTS